MSLLATLLLSATSTLAGITTKWTMPLPRRPPHDPPPGDTVIRWPNGSWLIVKCDETLARELFFAPETIIYNLEGETHFMSLSLVGTLCLMVSVIALVNAHN